MKVSSTSNELHTPLSFKHKIKSIKFLFKLLYIFTKDLLFWNASLITKLLKKLCCQIPDDQPKVYNFISLKKLGFEDIPFSGHLGEKVVCLECISDKTINCDGYRCKPQCISPTICLTLESYKCTWHRTSHIDPESAKNCQILAWETCNVYINCDINSNHDCTTLTISTQIDKMVSVIFNTHFNENF